MDVNLPVTVPDTEARIEALATIAHVSGWALAATVWAWTYETKGRPSKTDEKSPLLTLDQFASRGFRGLRSRDSVRAYRRAWQQAIDAGLVDPVEPGSPIVPPPLAWEERRTLAPKREPKPRPEPSNEDTEPEPRDENPIPENAEPANEDRITKQSVTIVSRSRDAISVLPEGPVKNSMTRLLDNLTSLAYDSDVPKIEAYHALDALAELAATMRGE